MNTLTAEQLQVYNAVLRGRNIFLTGHGGTGKSYLINVIYDDLPIKRVRPETGLPYKVAITALTGCAAILLGSHAKTIHSWAGIGIGKGDVRDLVGRIVKNGKAKRNWKTTDILVIDEISMMTPDLLEKLDEIGRIVRKCSKPFGGIQVILTGDFLQLPPVAKGEEVKFAFESERWNTIIDETYELKIIQRQRDIVFRKVLEEARIGKITADSVKILKSRMGLDWRSLKIRPTLLFPRRAEVDLINESNLKALTGPRYTYKAGIVMDEKVVIGFNPKTDEFKLYLERFDKDAGYVSELTLAVGAQVMLVKNISIETGLVNGARGVVVDFLPNAQHTPIVEFLCGITKPMIPENWEIDDYKGVYRTQVPLRLAYAVTTHKAQGATLDCAMIDIGSNIFEYGQAYVALSRVKSLECLYIHDFDEDVFTAHPRVLTFYEKLKLADSESETSDEPINYSLVNELVIPSESVVDEIESSPSNWLYDTIPPAWKEIVKPVKNIIEHIYKEIDEKTFLPAKENIWNALKLTSPESVKVVILGQDPYPTPGHAHGLAFSVPESVRPVAPSLRNIFKELENDIGVIRTHGCLEDWAKQGVFMINTILSVEPGKPLSHAKIGWEDVTDTILKALRGKGIIFVLWGKTAQTKKKILGPDEIYIESAHPSPLSAYNGFFDSKPFSRINQILRDKGRTEISWSSSA